MTKFKTNLKLLSITLGDDTLHAPRAFLEGINELQAEVERLSQIVDFNKFTKPNVKWPRYFKCKLFGDVRAYESEFSIGKFHASGLPTTHPFSSIGVTDHEITRKQADEIAAKQKEDK